MGKYIAVLLLTILLYSCQKQNKEDKYLSKIKGETITLEGEIFNCLMKDDIADLTLYGLNPDGSKVVYSEGIDYIVNGNQIKRSVNSVIPDFKNHNVTYSIDGKFTWNSEPNRNPELTLPYQIYADYSHQGSLLIERKSMLSARLTSKLARRLSIDIITIGTSITFGAHTYESYYNNSDKQTYPQLTSRAISKLFNVQCRITNFSTDGGGVNQIQDLQSIVNLKPDLVVLELGMNDHINPNMDYVKHFQTSLERAIRIFKDNSIDVVLIGFFQQIESWDRELPEYTVIYNDILKSLADKHQLCFVDIYSSFIKIDKTKLYRDYMGDYMHHPTSFGHQLYYLELMPFFVERAISEGELLELIYE